MKTNNPYVIRPRQKIFRKQDNLHSGIFISVFDSTSSSSGIRTIMETNQTMVFYVGTRITELNTNHFSDKKIRVSKFLQNRTTTIFMFK
ncbi:Leucine-rich repeat-containing protein [Dirofilaria immitis]